MEDPLKSTRSTAENIVRSISIIHKTEKAARISMGVDSTSASGVRRRGIESSRAMDRKKEDSIVAGRKKRTQG
jgi:hypothetical protein